MISPMEPYMDCMSFDTLYSARICVKLSWYKLECSSETAVFLANFASTSHFEETLIFLNIVSRSVL